jgi:hypothetical protein
MIFSLRVSGYRVVSPCPNGLMCAWRFLPPFENLLGSQSEEGIAYLLMYAGIIAYKWLIVNTIGLWF